MVGYRENRYIILYRLKGSNGSWYRWYYRRYTQEAVNRKYDRLISFKSPYEFTIISEPVK